jgi:hypothetical protein
MTAALVVGMVLGGAAAVLTYVALERRERAQASRTAARLREWEAHRPPGTTTGGKSHLPTVISALTPGRCLSSTGQR